MQDFAHIVEMGDVKMLVARYRENRMWFYRVTVPGVISEPCVFRFAELHESPRKRFESSPGGIHLKNKLMDNGELRFGVNVPDQGWYTVTVASRWSDYHEGFWQQSHYHRDLDEDYVVAHGWMIGACSDEHDEDWSAELFRAGHNVDGVTFESGWHHNVLLGPGAVIGTWQTKSSHVNWPIKDRGNPERDNNNWWPTDLNDWQREAEPHIGSIQSVAAWADCSVTDLV